jgi:uncharacterized integral membrane protein
MICDHRSAALRGPGTVRNRKENRMRREDDLGPEDPEHDLEPRKPPPPPRSGITPRQVIIVLFAIVLIAFAIANFEYVNVSFLLFESRARLVTVIVVAAALGFVIGYFVGRPTREQRRWLRKRRDEDRDRDRDRDRARDRDRD